MRGHVLFGTYNGKGKPSDAKPRTIAQLREAARCFARSAEAEEARGNKGCAQQDRRDEASALRGVEELAEHLRAIVVSGLHREGTLEVSVWND